MIFALRFQDVKVIDKFVFAWRNPDNILQTMTRGVYATMRFFRAGDLLIVEQENFFDLYARFALFIGLGQVFVGLLFKLAWLFNIGWLLVLFCIVFMSPYFHSFLFWMKLRLKGHKVFFVRDQTMIHKLLFEAENGSIRNL